MNHMLHKRERSEVKKLLLIEECLAERIISIIRMALVGYFAAMAIIRSLAHRQEMLALILPVSILGAAAIFLLVMSLVAGKRALQSGHYGEPMKYIHITVDVALIAYLAHTGLGFIRETSPGLNTVLVALLYTACFMLAAVSYQLVNLFRFHRLSSLYAGALFALIYFVIPFINPFLVPLLRDIRLLSENLMYLGLFASLFLVDTVLALLLAGRVRGFLLKNKVQERLARFLPETIDRELLERGQDIPDKGVRCRATILFADIQGFTALAESLTPEETVDLLNTYFNDMIQVVFKYEGAVDKLIGDGLMAIFGAPLKSLEPEANAVRAAVDMIRKLEGLNALRRHQKKPPLKIGIGVHTGEVVLGSIGSERRMDFTAVGDTVNIASRLENFTRNAGGRIIVSEATRAKLGNEFSVQVLGKVMLKGKTQPLKVFAVNPWLKPVKMDETQA
jgi:class 3 adenylate cyclase